MKIRKRFPFDFVEWTDCKFIQLLAASADKRTWYVKGGANCGIRLLAYFTERGVYTAPRLHDEVLVESAQPGAVRALFRHAANEKSEIRLIEQSEIQLLEKPDILPGFQFPNWKHSIGEPEGPVYPVHKSGGWHTKTERVLRLAPPWWAPDAQAFDIREGVYLYFPDGTSRLARRRDYYRFEDESRQFIRDRKLLSRQGDLIFLSNTPFMNNEPLRNEVSEGWVGNSLRTRPVDTAEIIDLDRHHIDTTQGVVVHPEHGTMPLPEEAWLAILEPGTSRPFSLNYNSD
jgi:hypothetical protein